MSNKPIALLDANILYPAQLRNLFVQLAYDGVYLGRWTDDIHEEWTRAVFKDYDNIGREKLERIRAKMDAKVPQALIIGYKYIIPTLELPDGNDRHVLAAAIKGECGFIITKNLADFPSDVLARHGIRAQSPDDFLCQLLDEIPDDACLSIRTIRKRLTRPHYSVEAYLDMLEEGQSLPQTVAALRKINPSML